MSESATENTEILDTAESAVEVPQAMPEELETFDRDYVSKLRAEAAEARVRAKLTDAANEQLVRAYAAADGRLVDVEALPMTSELIGEDGLVDADKVREAVDALVTAKPYLQARRLVAPLPQGVREDAADTPGLFSIFRQRMT